MALSREPFQDQSGGAVPNAAVQVRNESTNLTVSAQTSGSGTYNLSNLAVGTYEVKFLASGFQTETHTQVLVQGDRATTVNANLQVGTATAVVEVTGTPLMNQVDTTNAYVVDERTIQNTPLGTGSFTQLAILAPGTHADFLGGVFARSETIAACA